MAAAMRPDEDQRENQNAKENDISNDANNQPSITALLGAALLYPPTALMIFLLLATVVSLVADLLFLVMTGNSIMPLWLSKLLRTVGLFLRYL